MSSPSPALLSGRMDRPVNELTQIYTASIGFDYRLAKHDIEGSLAHAAMLAKQGIISDQDLQDIQRGMAMIAKEVEAGTMAWELASEDVHMNIEKKLIALIGEAGRRLHTGRSRNDQVATDIRLYLRESIDTLRHDIKSLQTALVTQAEANINTIMPGFTHLQVAQPISFAHHMLAYFEMLQRDVERLVDTRKRVNRLPLGAAALAGTTYPIDREHVMASLGFEALCHNSMDAVSDRDFAIEFLSAASITMMHLSRLSEELILWMNPAWGFVDIADEFCTTSSIMPQKKNPDIPELARGKSGRVFGHLMALLTVMKAQPLAYNKDNQEDKEPLFDTVDTLTATLKIFTAMMSSLRVKPYAMRQALDFGHAGATDLADFLVRQGMTFRDAHHIVAKAVNHATHLGKDLSDLSLLELQGVIPNMSDEGRLAMGWERSLHARNHVGGTAPQQINDAILRARSLLMH